MLTAIARAYQPGLIDVHHHSAAFRTEVQDYVALLGLGDEAWLAASQGLSEAELSLLMLSASVAAGVMKTCSRAGMLEGFGATESQVHPISKRCCSRRPTSKPFLGASQFTRQDANGIFKLSCWPCRSTW